MSAPQTNRSDAQASGKQVMHEASEPTGKQETWTAVYARYRSRYEEECNSLAEARAFLRHGEEYGELSSIHIVGPDGQIIEYDYVHDNEEGSE